VPGQELQLSRSVAQIAYPASDVTIGTGWVVPVDYKSSASRSGTSIRLPTQDSGDIILISARRTGSITAPTFRISGIGAAQPPLLPRCATG
jgi:hypothetical protein